MLEDKIVIVSGIGPGMGRDISLACARDGADIVLAARTQATLEVVAAEVQALGRRTLSVPTDVTDADQCRNLVERALEEFGRIDVLVNNAATGGHEVPLSEATERQIQHAIRINLGGTLNMTQAVIPAMREGGGGSIVITGTLAMRRIQRGRGTYAASKSALMTAAQTLALELGAGQHPRQHRRAQLHHGRGAEVLVSAKWPRSAASTIRPSTTNGRPRPPSTASPLPRRSQRPSSSSPRIDRGRSRGSRWT